MAASFSGRYAVAAKANDSLPKPDGPPPGGSKSGKGNVPPTKVVSSKGTGAGGGAAEDDENPYLKDSPYYLASLKDKADDAKAEILGSNKSSGEMTGAQRIAARRAAAMERAKQSGDTDVSSSSKARLGYEGGSVAVDIDENFTGGGGRSSISQKSEFQKKKEEDYQKAKSKYELQKKESMKVGLDDDGEGMLPAAVRFDEDTHRDPFATPKCRDMFCGMIFILHLIAIVILAVVRGVPEYLVLLNENGATGQVEFENSYQGDVSISSDGELSASYDVSMYHSLNEMNGFKYVGETDTSSSEGHEGGSAMSSLTASVLTLSVTGAMSVMAAFLLLELALASPLAMVQFGLGGVVLASAAMACVMIITGPDILGAIVWSVITAFVICFVISVQDGVTFAAANLSAAAAAIRKHRQTMTVAAGFLILQLLWLSVWVVAVLGVGLRNHRSRQESMPPSSMAYTKFAQNALQHHHHHHESSLTEPLLVDDFLSPDLSGGSDARKPFNFTNLTHHHLDLGLNEVLAKGDDINHVHEDDAYGAYYYYAGDSNGNSHNNGQNYNNNADGNNGQNYNNNADGNNGQNNNNDDGSNGQNNNNDEGSNGQNNNNNADGNNGQNYNNNADGSKGQNYNNADGSNGQNNYINADGNNGQNNNNADDYNGQNYNNNADGYNQFGGNNGNGMGSNPYANNDDQQYANNAGYEEGYGSNSNKEGYSENNNDQSGDNGSGKKKNKNKQANDDEFQADGLFTSAFNRKKLLQYGDDISPDKPLSTLPASYHLPQPSNDDTVFTPIHIPSHHKDDGTVSGGDDEAGSQSEEDGEEEDQISLREDDTDDETYKEGEYQGDDEWGEFFGLGEGCKTLIVDYQSAPRLGVYIPNGTIGVYCACENGDLISYGMCDTADFARIELRHGSWMYFLLALSLYWGGQVLAGIVHVTASGTVGAWWFGANAYDQGGTAKFAYAQLKDAEKGSDEGKNNGDDDGTALGAESLDNENQDVADTSADDGQVSGGAAARRLALQNKNKGGFGQGVANKFKQLEQEMENSLKTQKRHFATNNSVVNAAMNRAIGPSFGSICFGALFVAFFSTVETMFRYMRKSCFLREDENNKGGICCVCVFCLDACLRMLREVMEYFNRWAFTYVAIYGDSFMRGGRNACGLFNRRGWSMVLTDTLCATSLTFASLSVSVFIGIIAYFIATLFGALDMRSLLVCASMIISYMICTCVTSVLDAGVLTVLVCFAEDPVPCAENHPKEFNDLIEAWTKAYSPELNVAGYDKFLVNKT